MKHNLLGKRFGSWLVIAKAPNKGKMTYWRCRCGCGTEKDVQTVHLIGSKSTNCGCLRNQKLSLRNYTHGHSFGKWSPEYQTWVGMKGRCLNPNDPAYPRYGGRGVTIECRAWIDDFSTFFRDMGRRPKGTSLERLDNERGYGPKNCVWATSLEQQNNRRDNIRVNYGESEITLSQLARLKGLSYKSLWRLYKERGLPIEEAVTHAVGLKG